jgi:hypothetical protein
MRRRHFLQTGVFGGAIALGTQLSAEAPAAAAGGVKSRFFEGSLIDGPFAGYALQIGVAAARSRGTATPPDSESSLDVVPMSGMLLGEQLSLAIYSAARDGDQVQIGTLNGTLKGKSLKGSYTVDSGGKGTFATKLVAGNKKSMKKVSGVYEGSVNFIEAYAPGWSGVTTLKPNGNWEVSDVQRPDGTHADVRFAGIYVLPSRHGASAASHGVTPVLAMLLPVKSKGIRGLGICDCECCEPDDKDGDGTVDSRDDSDGDGIPDSEDKDWDNDGLNDDVDPDDDNDGKPDDQDDQPFTDTELEKEREALRAAAIGGVYPFTVSPTGGFTSFGMPAPFPGGNPIIATGRKR